MNSLAAAAATGFVVAPKDESTARRCRSIFSKRRFFVEMMGVSLMPVIAHKRYGQGSVSISSAGFSGYERERLSNQFRTDQRTNRPATDFA